jgi:murein DD-endopeptidase MepM/ murein hydrolase activator NlpD
MIAAIEQQKVVRRRSYPQLSPRRQHPATAGQARIRVVRRSGRGALAWIKHIPRRELVLGAVLALGVLVPLAFRVTAAVPLRPTISLPAGSEEQGILYQHLIPDEPAAGPGSRPANIGSLRLSQYTIQLGDTLSSVAQRFGLNMDSLVSFNGIQDARALRAGTVLAVPNSNGLKYRVRRGDSLGGIAKRFGIEFNGLLDWNSLETSVIRPGQELFIPGARLSEHELNRVFGRLFIFPTRGRLSSRFGVRGDPITGVSRFHNGIDLANSIGTPVMATMSGKVSMLGFNPNFGRYIILSHPEGFQTLYGHLDSFLVRKGQRVKQGELIGLMGNSGYSTGSHLHFSIFNRGEPVDPFRYLH